MGRTKALILAAVTGVLAACGSMAGGSYADPQMQYGEHGRCYYVDSPAEVAQLIDAGRCPVSWMPAPMPIAWHDRYAYVYDSPSYYNTYVPRANRATYVTHVRVYESAHPAAVRTAPKVKAFTQQKAPAGSFKTGRQGGDSATSRTTSNRSFSSQRSSGSGSFKTGRR